MRKILTYCLPLALIFMSVTETHAISGEKAKQEKARLEAAALAGAVAGAALQQVIGAVNTIISNLPDGYGFPATVDRSNLKVVLDQIDVVVRRMSGQAALVTQAVTDMNSLITNLPDGYGVDPAGPQNLRITDVAGVVRSLRTTIDDSIVAANTIRQGLRSIGTESNLALGEFPLIDFSNIVRGLQLINDNIRTYITANQTELENNQ